VPQPTAPLRKCRPTFMNLSYRNTVIGSQRVEFGQLLFLTSTLRLLIDTRTLSQKRKPVNNRL
jgi:hypothetical protein